MNRIDKTITSLIDELPDVIDENEVQLIKRREPPRARQAPSPAAAADPELSQLITNLWHTRQGKTPVVLEVEVISKLRAEESRAAERRAAELEAAAQAQMPILETETDDEKVARITAELSPHVEQARAYERDALRAARKLARTKGGR